MNEAATLLVFIVLLGRPRIFISETVNSEMLALRFGCSK